MLLITHETNNIYEGFGNIHKGPKLPSTVGPARYFYQQRLGSIYKSNMTYGNIDLTLSSGEMMRFSRKAKSIQLFRRDPINISSSAI